MVPTQESQAEAEAVVQVGTLQQGQMGGAQVTMARLLLAVGAEVAVGPMRLLRPVYPAAQVAVLDFLAPGRMDRAAQQAVQETTELQEVADQAPHTVAVAVGQTT